MKKLLLVLALAAVAVPAASAGGWATVGLSSLPPAETPRKTRSPASSWSVARAAMVWNGCRRYGFVIASDECYSEIYFRDHPPLGGLEAAMKVGLADFRNLVVFTSLSKRSNVPGMRSGFVAGDARILKQFLLYRTYHGCAMSGMVQAASIAAWNDEAHVAINREMYRAKFATVTPLLIWKVSSCLIFRCVLNTLNQSAWNRRVFDSVIFHG